MQRDPAASMNVSAKAEAVVTSHEEPHDSAVAGMWLVETEISYERSKAVRSIYFHLTEIVAGSVTIDWVHCPRFGGFSPAALRSNANGVRTRVTRLRNMGPTP